MTQAEQAETIRAQQAQIAELQAEVDAERRHHGIRNASVTTAEHFSCVHALDLATDHRSILFLKFFFLLSGLFYF